MKFTFRTGGVPLLISPHAANITPLQVAFDFSGSMKKHFSVLEDAAITTARNDICALIFSSSTKTLPEDVTSATFDRVGSHYDYGTLYTGMFQALQNDDFPLHNSRVVIITDGMPMDLDESKKAAIKLHESMGPTGQILFYFLGDLFPAQEQVMKALSYPVSTPPVCFQSDTLQEIMYGTLRDNVPATEVGEGLATGIWLVTKLDPEAKEEEVIQDLSTCKEPQVAVACVAAILNFMRRHNLKLSHEDGKRINGEVLQAFNQSAGVVELMDKVRGFTAASGLRGVYSASMATLAAKANLVTGSIPDEDLIRLALMALVKNPDKQYALQSKAQRNSRKAVQKIQALSGKLKFMDPVLEAAANYFVTALDGPSYRIQAPAGFNLLDGSVASTAVAQNPECFHIKCDGVLVPTAHGTHALLPQGCQSEAYVKALTFRLLGQVKMLQTVVTALKAVVELPGFSPPVKAFAHNPADISARNFVFYPFFIKGDPLHIEEAFVQGVAALLKQSCTPLELDSRRVNSVVDIKAALQALSADTCNFSALATSACSTLQYLTQVDNPSALAGQILASYTAHAPPPAGITPPIPTLEQLLNVLRASAHTLLPNFRGLSTAELVDRMICEAGLRLSVAADSLGAHATATDLYSCQTIQITEQCITFRPSEPTAKSELFKRVALHLGLPDAREDVSKPWVGAFSGGPLLASPLVYFRLFANDKPSMQAILANVDALPTAAWPKLALECASEVASSNPAWSLAVAQLTGEFNASALSAEDVAFVLTSADDCSPKGVQDPEGVLRCIKFNPHDMRNCLDLLHVKADGLRLLQTAEGSAFTPQQIVIGRKLAKLGVDVSQYKELLADHNLIERIRKHWIKRGVDTPEKALNFFVEPVKTRKHGLPRHATCYQEGMTPMQFYQARKAQIGFANVRAVRRTQALGSLLQWFADMGVN